MSDRISDALLREIQSTPTDMRQVTDAASAKHPSWNRTLVRATLWELINTARVNFYWDAKVSLRNTGSPEE